MSYTRTPVYTLFILSEITDFVNTLNAQLLSLKPILINFYTSVGLNS